LAGQMNAVRIMQIRQTDIAQSSLANLQKIESNTSFNRQIPQIISVLLAIESALGNPLANSRATGR
jgi:hypothetical protein